MGYRIEYGSDGAKTSTTSQVKPKISRKRVLISITAAAVTALLLWPAGRIWVRDLLLPGDEEVTAAALGSLIEDLSDGEPVGEAVESFCREILAGA